MERLNLDDMGRVILPQPADIPKREKEDAMGAYLMMFAAMGAGLPLPLVNLLAAIIYYFVNKKKSRYVSFHAFQSLITQIPISIMNGFLLGWFIRLAIAEFNIDFTAFLVYLGFVVLWNIVYAILSIVACVKARKGQLYYMLLFGPLAFGKFYGDRAIKEQERWDKAGSAKNTPPPGY